MVNQIVLVGRIVRAPEVRTTETGKKVSTITLAVPRNYKNANGEYDTDFLDCTLWSSIAESTSEYCQSGDMIGVKGRLQNRIIEMPDGNKKRKTEVGLAHSQGKRVFFLRSDKIEENEIPSDIRYYAEYYYTYNLDVFRGNASSDEVGNIQKEIINNNTNKEVKEYYRNINDLQVYYNVGKLLSIELSKSNLEAKELIKEYSQKLTEEIGKGYNWYNLYRMLEYYNLLNTNKELQNLPSKLSWTHFSILIDLKDINKINYYAKLAVYENLSYRKLREKIKNNNYENKIPIKKLNNSISKEMLKNLLLQDIDNFLSLLGEDITYVKKNYLISKQEYIDVLLYSIKKNSYIVVQIKNDELNKEYLEEIKKSMHYIDKKVKTNKENKTEGIIIGKYNEKYQIIFTSNPNIIMNKTIKY